MKQSPFPLAVFLMGPTATGKTQLAMELCDHHPFELISVDSALVYRGMDLGTAKPGQDLLDRYPHHLINIRDPSEAYSSSDFCADAEFLMHEIASRNRIPLLVGGTMLYFKNLKDGMADLPRPDVDVRRAINRLAEASGWETVHQELAKVDPDSAARIHPNDPQRLQRALEIFRVTGRTMTELHQEQGEFRQLPFNLCQMALIPKQRSSLHQRIAERFRNMLDAGFLEEVRELHHRGDLDASMPSIRAVGYRQVWQYLDGEICYDEMVERGIIATRQLAKRQLTWLRNWPDLYTLEAESESVSDQALEILAENFI